MERVEDTHKYKKLADLSVALHSVNNIYYPNKDDKRIAMERLTALFNKELTLVE